jgi:hypothetical protein
MYGTSFSFEENIPGIFISVLLVPELYGIMLENLGLYFNIIKNKGLKKLIATTDSIKHLIFQSVKIKSLFYDEIKKLDIIKDENVSRTTISHLMKKLKDKI